MKVLLLDDDMEFCNLVKPILQNIGLIVLACTNAEEAEKILSNDTPAMMLVNSRIPNIDTLDWIGKLRTRGCTVEIIYLTTTWQDLQNYYMLSNDLKIALIIQKPIMPAILQDQVQQLASKIRTKTDFDLDLKNKSIDDLEASLAALSTQFALELPERIAKLTLACHKIRNNADNGASAEEARILAHRLRGTAGSYGLPELSALTGEIEDLIIEINQHPDHPLWSEIPYLLEEAEKIAKVAAANAYLKSQDSLAISGSNAARSNGNSHSKLLVVDDDEQFLDFVQLLAKQRLIDVVRARDSTEALDMARKHHIDAALIDVQLGPGNHSFQLAGELRSLAGYDDLPLAFISANSHVYNHVAAAHAGATLFLNKPLDSDTLEQSVQHLFALAQQEHPRVLVVDDDALFLEKVKVILQAEGIEVITLTDPLKILEVLHETTPDLLLLDVQMAGLSGFDVCRMLRTIYRWQTLPIIFITSHTDISTRVTAFHSGGDDYLPKPFASEELISRIKIRIDRAHLLKEKADRDPISGLWLRRAFIEQFKEMLSLAEKQNFEVTLGLIDVDNFKNVNDNSGHLAGDAVLAGLGRLMRHRFRPDDLRGRWGGDEFILGIKGLTPPEAHQLSENFLDEFNKIEFLAENGQSFRVGLSIGLASFPKDSKTLYDLIHIADKRLYKAKEGGRNQVISTD